MLIKSKTKVEKLTERVDKFYDSKWEEDDKRAKQEANLKTIRAAPKFDRMDFWCNKHGDTTGMAYKVVFGDLGELKAYYESLGYGFPEEMLACDKGLRRRITDKQTDPYFTESEMLKKQQREAKDKGYLLQPGQYGFSTKYGDPNKKKYAQLEKQDKANWEAKKSVF